MELLNLWSLALFLLWDLAAIVILDTHTATSLIEGAEDQYCIDTKEMSTSDTSPSTCPMIVLNDKSIIPAVGLGVYQAKQGPETYEAVLHALKAGYRHIDTAALYRNEESVGKAITDSKIPRDQIWITTKLWAMSAIQFPDPFDYVIKDAQSRVQRLGTYCDLYLIHSPHGGHAKRVRMWQAMEKLQKDGIVRSIGVSNFHPRHIQALISDPSTSVVPAVNQIELHPFLIQDEIVNYCHKHGIHIEAYSPLAKARRLNDPVLGKIAKSHNRTPAQVMIRWSLQRGFITLPKSVTPSRIDQNFDVFSFALTTEDMKEISNLDEDFHTGWDPTVIE